MDSANGLDLSPRTRRVSVGEGARYGGGGDDLVEMRLDLAGGRGRGEIDTDPASIRERRIRITSQ